MIIVLSKIKKFTIKLFRTFVFLFKDTFTFNNKETKKEIVRAFIISGLLIVIILSFFKYGFRSKKTTLKSEPERFITEAVELWYFNGMKDTVEIERPEKGKYKLNYHRNTGYYLAVTNKEGSFYNYYQNVINYKILNNGQTKK